MTEVIICGLVWCELRFVTDGELFRDPFALLAANSPGRG